MENFTSTISHEFKTPVGTALTFIDMMLKEILAAHQIKYLNMVKTSLNLLQSLVSDLLDLQQIKTGAFSVGCLAFNPTEAIQFVMSLLSIQAKS